MKDTGRKDIRLWKANSIIRKFVSKDKNVVDIYLTEKDANDLEREHPMDYLRILRIWQHALMNQVHYRIENNDIIFACSHLLGLKVNWFVFTTEKVDEDLYIKDIHNNEILEDGKWLLFKQTSRAKAKRK